MEGLGYYNGEIKPIKELKIPVTDRAVYFGDGVYEVCYCVNQKPFAIDEHINRFYSSLNLLKIEFKMEKKDLKQTIENMLKKHNAKHQSIYWQVSRASAIRDHVFPCGGKPNLLIMVTEKRIVDMKKIRYDLILEKDTRFLHCNIKTLNLIPAVLASEKAKQQNCHEAVLHRGETITECAHSNIGILKNGIFRTAPLNNLILPGVTRAHLIKICNNLDVPVLEKPFTIDELLQADEVVVLASGCLCMGVNSINGQKVGNKAQYLLKTLQNSYEKLFINQCGTSYV